MNNLSLSIRKSEKKKRQKKSLTYGSYRYWYTSLECPLAADSHSDFRNVKTPKELTSLSETLFKKVSIVLACIFVVVVYQLQNFYFQSPMSVSRNPTKTVLSPNSGREENTTLKTQWQQPDFSRGQAADLVVNFGTLRETKKDFYQPHDSEFWTIGWKEGRGRGICHAKQQEVLYEHWINALRSDHTAHNTVL